jgi:hypothetical protein
VISLLMALACQGTDPTDPSDDSPGPDSEAPGDDTAQDSSVSWQTLAEDCTEPSDLPQDPLTLVGAKQITQSNPGEFFVEIVDVELGPDELVYAAGQGGLVLYDFSDLDQVQDLGSWPSPQSHPRFHRVEAITDGVVAATHRDQGLEFVDVSDTHQLALIEAVPGMGMEGMAAVGDRLYVSSRDGGLIRIFDVSDPSDPSELGPVSGMPSNTWELLDAEDGWLYAADQEEGLVPISLADPDAPSRGTALDLGVGVQHGVVHGDWIYAALGGNGVAVIDRSDPSAPVEVSRLSSGGSVVQVSVGDGLLWAADHDGIAVWSLQDPSSPSPLARETSDQFALAVAAEGHSAYLGDWSWLGRWDLDTSVSAPEARLDRSQVAFETGGGTQLIQITNFGSDTLVLSGATAEGLDIEVSTTELAPGESGRLRLTWAGGDSLESTLCLATNDPDEPLQQVQLIAGNTASYLGSPAPDFTLKDLDGNTHKLSEQLGHPVVLAYFATW